MKITILGCGAFGTAIASTFTKKEVNLWIWSKFEKELIEAKKDYKTINISTSLEESCHASDLIIVAVPINFIKSTILELKPFYNNEDILIASKGIEVNSNQFANEIITSILGKIKLGIISGGSFAIDMKNKNILGLTLATENESIKEKVQKYKIEDKVIFIGATNIVQNYLQAIDVFVLPSLFEGLPVVGIEAQASGTNCIFSDKITRELKLTDFVEFANINSIEEWVTKIKNAMVKNNNKKVLNFEFVNNYDISIAVKKIQQIYLEC